MTTNLYRFRSVENWKSSLMALPDSSFFELMRSIFGNIKTPFSKQRLMDDLFALLSRNDIRKTLAAYIDEEDHKLIAATALLEDPSPKELEEFFQGEKSSTSLHSLLVNLEERLVIYRFSDEANNGKRRLALNPVLEPVLSPLAAAMGVLFPSAEAPVEYAEAVAKVKMPVDDNRILTALISFISGEDEFYRAGAIRKKVMDQAKRLFPDLNLETIARVLELLGLFFSQEEKLVPDDRKIREFGALSPAERRTYWAAGLYHYLTLEEARKTNPEPVALAEGGGDQVYTRGRLRRLAFLIHRFCAITENEPQNFIHENIQEAYSAELQKLFPEISFRRWIRLLELKDPYSTWGMSLWETSAFQKEDRTDFILFMKALEMAGILSPMYVDKSQNPCRMFIPVNAIEEDGPFIAMNSAFSFILYPGISFDKALTLASFSSIKEGTPFCFELSRSSVFRGLDLGLGSADMIKLLKELSGNRIDEGLEWTLKDWENRYAGVSLYEGLLLSLSEEMRYLVETRPIASLVRKTLAPGLYLLSGESGETVEALQKAGVDMVARPKPAPEKFKSISPRVFHSLAGIRETQIQFSPPQSLQNASEETEHIKEHFRQHLSGLSFIPKAEKDELFSRIERRLIISETQLEKAAVKYERLEARMLDYPGKTAIAKQAIADGSPVEVSWPGPGGLITVSTGIPQALEKKEGENILVLKPFLDQENSVETIRIPLGKISLLRRIKLSIFEY